MKWIRYVTPPLAVALATVAVPGTTQASDDPAKVEASAIERVSAANTMSNRHGRYSQARAMAIEGDGSIRARTAAWLGNMQSYVTNWNTALALSDLRTEMPYSEFESELAKTLEAQSQKLAELSDEGRRIAAVAEAALALIAQPEAIPAFPDLAQYQSTLDALALREDDLRTMLQETGHTASARLARLGEVDALSRKAVVGRLKLALLANGRYPLDQTLATVTALLDAEKAIDPTLARLTTAFTKMNEYNANLALFHAKEAIAPVRTDCASARAAVGGLPSSAFVNGAKTRVEQLCTGIETLYTSLTGDTTISNAEYVEEYLRTEKTKIRTVCPQNAASVACEKLALLASLSPEDLRKMDDARLKFVELGWSEAMNRAQGK